MRKILRLRLALAMVILIALTSATTPLTLLAPVLANAGAQLNYENAMPKKEDIFRGSFSRYNLNLVLNQPHEVTFSFRPTMDVPNAKVSFIMPADLVKLVKGNRVWTGDVKKGETINLEFSIEASEEVEGNVRVDVEASPEGKNYSSSYSLHVATPNVRFAGGEEGGEVRAVKPEAEILAASNPESPRALSNPESPDVSVNPESPGTFRIKGRWIYKNEYGTYSPGRYMKIEIWDYDTTSADDHLKTGWTDANGYFDITAPNDDGWLAGTADPYVRFIAEGQWDWITKTSGGSTYWWRYPSSGSIRDNVPDNWLKDIGTRSPISSYEALQAGDAVFEEAQWIYDRTGWERSGKVDIRWPEGTWPHSHGNNIHLPSKSTWSWTHVTVHHEYAHVVMYALYGHFPSGWGPSPHTVVSESSGGFAMTEGWAEFMQAAVDNKASNLAGYGGNIESNTWYDYKDTGPKPGTGMDGGIIEGSVASIFWDINDPKSTADKDDMYWGFNEIFIVMRYNQPDNMDQFWSAWITRWSSLSTSKGPLSTIYWHYGIDKDYYSPYAGSIKINAGSIYTTSGSVTLTLSASDWGSGAAYMRFRNYGGSWTGWYTYATSKSWTLLAGDGTRYVYVQFKDKKGYTSYYYYDSIIKDTVKPTGSIIINSGNPTYTKSGSVTLYLTFSDATSGVDKVRYQNSGASWTSWLTPTTTKAWTLTAGDGTKRVYYQIKDKAGWISTTYSDTIIKDTVKPVTTISHAPGSSTVSLSATDATSGVYKTYYRIDGGSWITYTAPFTLTGTGTHKIDYYSRDKAGNIETVKSLTVHYLTVNTDPAGITTISGTGWYNAGTTATTGTAPATVTSGGKTYTFSTWKKDGTAVSGNPINVVMDAPHTATATYIEAKATIEISTDKTYYNLGDSMTVSLRLKNPGSDLPVRIIVAVMFPDSSITVTLDATVTLPAGLDTTLPVHTFTLPSLPTGIYYWIAVLMDPATSAWIDWDYTAWAFGVTPAPMIVTSPSLPTKIQ